MRPFELYKHKRCRDVAIMPLKNPVYIREKKGFKVKIRWFNVSGSNAKAPSDMNQIETVFISDVERLNWRLYEPV